MFWFNLIPFLKKHQIPFQLHQLDTLTCSLSIHYMSVLKKSSTYPSLKEINVNSSLLSIYVIESFHKESKTGKVTAMQFIVGAVRGLNL